MDPRAAVGGFGRFGIDARTGGKSGILPVQPLRKDAFCRLTNKNGHRGKHFRIMSSSENHEAQFTAMIREHLPMFRGLAHRILGEPADVDDAVQSALLKAWQRRQTFHEEARLTSWVA